MYSVNRPFPSDFPAARHLINGRMSPVMAGCAGHFGTTYQLTVRLLATAMSNGVVIFLNKCFIQSNFTGLIT